MINLDLDTVKAMAAAIRKMHTGHVDGWAECEADVDVALSTLINRGYAVVPATAVPSPEVIDAMRYAAVILADVIHEGDEWCAEALHEALHYMPHVDGYQGHYATLDAYLKETT